MLKIISASLLAASLVAAPAMAAGTRSHAAPAAKSVQLKGGVLNAKAKMARHHHGKVHHRHHAAHHRHHMAHR
jgi:hypothetical protein